MSRCYLEGEQPIKTRKVTTPDSRELLQDERREESGEGNEKKKRKVKNVAKEKKQSGNTGTKHYAAVQIMRISQMGKGNTLPPMLAPLLPTTTPKIHQCPRSRAKKLG